MGLLPYAVSQVFRGRRRTISSMIGIALTVAFLSGTFIAVDSSLRAIAEGRLASAEAAGGMTRTQASLAPVAWRGFNASEAA